MTLRRPASESFADVDRAALFGRLADGRHHRIDALAAATGTADRDVRAALDALATLGMPLRFDADGVLAPPCVPLDRRSIGTAFDTLTPDRRAPGRDVQVAFTTGSTNADLLDQVRRGAGKHAPLVLASEFQSAGRGRLGRRWLSAGGESLTVSFAIPIAKRLAALDGVTLACGLAVHRVVCGYGVPARLKWPNDLLLDGRKLAGILVEAHASEDRTMLVVGVGVNIAGVPAAVDGSSAGVSSAAAALATPGTPPVDRNLLVARLGVALEDQMQDFAARGFAPLAEAWARVDAYRDRPVVVGAANDTPLFGVARGVDDTGALLLDVAGEIRRITVGDVSLRPAKHDGRVAAT